jgi:macrolide transport system ATP-binding/permease protein
VSPRYFAAVGAPLLWGRAFVERDTADSPPVAIVNAAIASKYWPGQDPIGKQVGLPIAAFNMTIVGVAVDVKHPQDKMAAPAVTPPSTPAPERGRPGGNAGVRL